MKVSERLLTVTVASLMAFAVCNSTALADGVLPATAQPHGWSLTDMTSATALFTTSGNQAAYYPATPFQILYADPATSQAVPVGDGYLSTASNHFEVRPGTAFFVPVWNADDSPPIVGTWPQTHRMAIPYFFAPSQVGGKDFAIIVDGSPTQLGPAYLAGPVTTPPLNDGGGTHFLTVGAFLTPLAPGRHTVELTGGVFGSEIAATYPFAFLQQDLTYTVTVGH